ncbi:hypothetical protein L1987_05692 [Smallanthus sonchifolius]|uniref:Uncharacterized protein n=1 Tax=Smallanthus sonchifolius TaxID=185202 RepID=A0ACB9JW65_9ASTR|nr:hypothetical protein L1987_05692 [Smallanthus sonchifolius]
MKNLFSCEIWGYILIIIVNNEVLKALCTESGWIVLPHGARFRKGKAFANFMISTLHLQYHYSSCLFIMNHLQKKVEVKRKEHNATKANLKISGAQHFHMVGAVSLPCPRPQATEPSRLAWFSTTGSLQLGSIAATTSSNPNIEQLNNIVDRLREEYPVTPLSSDSHSSTVDHQQPIGFPANERDTLR